MKQRIEDIHKTPFLPGIRKPELMISEVKRKLENKEPLDKEERALLEKWREEERQDDQPRYGH